MSLRSDPGQSTLVPRRFPSIAAHWLRAFQLFLLAAPFAMPAHVAAEEPPSQQSGAVPVFSRIPVEELPAPVLVVEGPPSDAIRDLFWQLAGKYRARIVVLAADDKPIAEHQYPWQI